MKKLGLFFAIVWSLTSTALSQEKNEREKRIQQEEFPQIAVLELQKILGDDLSIRYYHEFDGQAESYEAKFKWEKHHFSIEFDTTGLVQDVEIRVRRKELPEQTMKGIRDYLDKEYDDWRLEKIQIQYDHSANGKRLIDAAINHRQSLDPKYELIVASKLKGKISYYEMLFSEGGTLLLKRKVVKRSYDFLRF